MFTSLVVKPIKRFEAKHYYALWSLDPANSNSEDVLVQSFHEMCLWHVFLKAVDHKGYFIEASQHTNAWETLVALSRQILQG